MKVVNALAVSGSALALCLAAATPAQASHYSLNTMSS
jgi:hypothetical protein